MKIYLLFLLTTPVICRPNEANRQLNAFPGFQSTNDLDGIVYLDGGSAYAGKNIGRSHVEREDQKDNAKTSENNDYSYVRRKVDPTTSAITPIDQLPIDTYENPTADIVDPVKKYAVGRSNSPGSLRMTDNSYGEERNFESDARLGEPNILRQTEYVDRTSNFDQDANHPYDRAGRLNGADTFDQANNIVRSNFALNVPVIRQGTIFTGLDGFSQVKRAKKTSHDDNSEPIVRAGPNPLGNEINLFNLFGRIAQVDQEDIVNNQINPIVPILNNAGSTNQNNGDPAPVRGSSSDFSSLLKIAPAFDNITKSDIETLLNNKVTSYALSSVYSQNTNRSVNDLMPNSQGILDLVDRFHVPFKNEMENNQYMSSECHCIIIHGHRSCTCDHTHNCDNGNCRGVAQTPTANFDQYIQGPTTPTPMQIVTKPMKIYNSNKNYNSKKPSCNCGCNCCNCGCNSQNQQNEYQFNEDLMINNENYEGFDDNYGHEDLAMLNDQTGGEVYPMTQSVGWSGMYGGGPGLVPYIPGQTSVSSGIGALTNMDIDSSEDNKGILGLGNENSFSGGSLNSPGGTGGVTKTTYGYGVGYGSGIGGGDFGSGSGSGNFGSGSGNFGSGSGSFGTGSGGFKEYFKKLLGKVGTGTSKKVYTKHVSSVYGM